MLTLAVILEALGRNILPADTYDSSGRELSNGFHHMLFDQKINGGVVDSRQAYSGCLFLAVAGKSVDGHNYIGDAFNRGAAIALVQNDTSQKFPTLDMREHCQISDILKIIDELPPGVPFCLLVEDNIKALQRIAGYWRSKLDLRVIGITGTVGKTTTKELTASLLEIRYHTLKNPGNLNNEIGLPLTLLSLNEEHECAVLEMGFYVPGEISLLCELAKPDIGVITNIGTVHAERAGSIETITQGKAELVMALPAAPAGVAILNYDDHRVREMAKQTKARVIYYGLSPEAHVWADEVEGLGLDGVKFRLHYKKEVFHLHVPLIGRHSVHTVLRATAVGLVEGLSWQDIIDGLHSKRTQLRLLIVKTSSGALILDDTYNASPESDLAALNLLDDLDGHKIAVLGDMLELGQYENEGHEIVGARAAEVVDQLITLGERGKIIAQAAWYAGLSKKMISSFTDLQQVIEMLEVILKEGDIVLIKGSRGMQMDQIVAALEKTQ